MARAEPPASLQEIRNPTSIQAQIAALKQLKNEIIGHDEKKELVIRYGIVAPLVRNLTSSLKASGKRRSREFNGGSEGLGRSESFGRSEAFNGSVSKDCAWTHEDELRLQSTYIVASLARGRPLCCWKAIMLDADRTGYQVDFRMSSR
jgi:armadillo repeat-containing protein 8